MADDHVKLQDIQWEGGVENINMKRNLGGGEGFVRWGEGSRDFVDSTFCLAQGCLQLVKKKHSEGWASFTC